MFWSQKDLDLYLGSTNLPYVTWAFCLSSKFQFHISGMCNDHAYFQARQAVGRTKQDNRNKMMKRMPALLSKQHKMEVIINIVVTNPS